MTRKLFALWKARPRHGATTLVDEGAADTAADARQAGWHQSSHDLRTGLSVVEAADETADFGADTRPITYYPEEAAA